MKTKHDDETLRAALVGYAAEMEKISAKMETLRQQLRGRTKRGANEPAEIGVPAAVGRKPQQKHRISAEGRERIRQAQVARWARARRASA